MCVWGSVGECLCVIMGGWEEGGPQGDCQGWEIGDGGGGVAPVVRARECLPPTSSSLSLSFFPLTDARRSDFFLDYVLFTLV